MTTNNYASSRDRVMKAIGSCRVIGFDWPDNMEEEYTEKIKEEFKRIPWFRKASREINEPYICAHYERNS